MDLLFASEKPWVWEAERTFAILKSENMQILHSASDAPVVVKDFYDDQEKSVDLVEGSEDSV